MRPRCYAPLPNPDRRGTGDVVARSTPGQDVTVLQALDDRGVGHAAALAHRLQAVTAAGALELVEQRRHEAGAGAAERVAERDGAAVHVDLAHVGVVLLLPRQ